MKTFPLWLRTGARRIVQWPFQNFKHFFIAGTAILAVVRWSLGYIDATELLSVLSIILKVFGLS
ncbi:hypothetical protein [Rufibacter soli]